MAERIPRFKKFTDIKREDDNNDKKVFSDKSQPMNPNIPNDNRKIEIPASKKSVVSSREEEKEISLNKDDNVEKLSDLKKGSVEVDEQVKTYGKVAKFPKNVKASKAYKFLENVKIPKKSIWYIMVEKQDNELQMIKYNYKEGVNLNQFIGELKAYYLNFYSNDKRICEAINKMYVDGNDKFSMVKNIPLIKINGKTMISKITEDLIQLLSK